MLRYRFWKPSSRKARLQWLLPIVAAIIIGGCGSGPPLGVPAKTAIQTTATTAVASAVTPLSPTLVPTPINSAMQAMLTAEKDLVQYQLQGQTEQDLAINASQLLGKGDAISVDTDGRASLDFLDAIRVDIFKDSDLSIKGSIDPDTSALELYALEGGTTLNEVDLNKIAAKRVRLETKWAVIDDLGTEFVAYYDPNTEATWIVVRKGLTEVRAPNANVPPDQQLVQVSAGEQTWIIPQEAPVQPLPATRAAVGDRFPSLEVLTDGEISDAEWLPSLRAIALDRATLISGQTTQGTITLSGPAFGGGLPVTLFSDNATVVTVPASVTVASDTTSQRFSVTAGAVSQRTNVVITASYQNDTREINLTIDPPAAPSPSSSPSAAPSVSPPPSPSPPPALADLTLNPATIESGTPGSGTVTISGPAPEGGVEISLISSDETLAAIPPTVTVPAGSDKETFEIQTVSVTQDTEITITASDINGPPLRQTLTLLAQPTLSSFTIEPARVTGGDVAQGEVVLTRPALEGGLLVDLSSNGRSVSAPDTVTIAEGDERVVFDIATRPVQQEFEAAIQASTPDAAITSLLTVVPPPQPDLTVEIGQIDVSCGGKFVVCYLTVGFTVRNQGNTDVRQESLVSIQADALEPTTVVVGGVAAGESLSLRARLGPGGNCYDPDCTVTITVDPNNAIREFDEANNSAANTWNG